MAREYVYMKKHGSGITTLLDDSLDLCQDSLIYPIYYSYHKTLFRPTCSETGSATSAARALQPRIVLSGIRIPWCVDGVTLDFFEFHRNGNILQRYLARHEEIAGGVSADTRLD